jgi:hypothetical protein
MRHLKIGVLVSTINYLRLPLFLTVSPVFASLLTCWPARSDVHNVHVVCVQYSGSRKYSVCRFCKAVATSVFFTWVSVFLVKTAGLMSQLIMLYYRDSARAKGALAICI